MGEDRYRDIRHWYNSVVYTLSYYAVKGFFDLLFRHKKATGLENLRAVQDSGAVLTSDHKSHTDYFLIPIHIYESGLKAPAIVAGDNLFVPGIGHWFRLLKGFKFKRGASQEEITRSMEYMKKLLKEENQILLFPEIKRDEEGIIKSGRSYTGEFNEFSSLPMRFMAEGVYFVPLAVAYSKTIEDDLFPKLSTGTSKNKFVQQDIPHILTHPLTYGRVDYQINFGEPMLFEKGSKRKSFLEELHKRTGRLYTVFPVALFAQAVRQIEKEGHVGNRIYYRDLTDKILEVHDRFEENGAIFSGSCSSIQRILDEAKYVFHHKKRKDVAFEHSFIVVRARQLVDYYANTIEQLVA